MFGFSELIVIALVIFVLFGAAAIPRFARSLGQAKAEFEKGVRSGTGEKKPRAKSAVKKSRSTKKSK